MTQINRTSAFACFALLLTLRADPAGACSNSGPQCGTPNDPLGIEFAPNCQVPDTWGCPDKLEGTCSEAFAGAPQAGNCDYIAGSTGGDELNYMCTGGHSAVLHDTTVYDCCGECLYLDGDGEDYGPKTHADVICDNGVEPPGFTKLGCGPPNTACFIPLTCEDGKFLSSDEETCGGNPTGDQTKATDEAPRNCLDGIDNDCDGNTDCQDTACFHANPQLCEPAGNNTDTDCDPSTDPHDPLFCVAGGGPGTGGGGGGSGSGQPPNGGKPCGQCGGCDGAPVDLLTRAAFIGPHQDAHIASPQGGQFDLDFSRFYDSRRAIEDNADDLAPAVSGKGPVMNNAVTHFARRG